MKHHDLTICFETGGTVRFYPESTNADELAQRLGRLVDVLHERPEAVRCAAGACDGLCSHGALGGGSA